MLALIGALVLSTLGYEFITRSTQSQGTAVTSAAQLIVNSLTRLPYQNNRESFGALLMFFVTWLFGGLLSITSMRRRNVLAAKDVLPAAGVWYGVSIGLALTFWLIHAGTLLSLSLDHPGRAAHDARSICAARERVFEAGGYRQQFAGNVLCRRVPVDVGHCRRVDASDAHLAGQVGQRLGPGGDSAGGDWRPRAGHDHDLNAIRADTIYKQAEPLRAQGQWDVAIAHYKRVLELAPDEDFYYLWLGAAYLEKAYAGPGRPIDSGDDRQQSIGHFEIDFPTDVQPEQAGFAVGG